MKFDDLDKAMRVFETAHDHAVLPGLYIVARIDGRNFTRLTKETHAFEAPYDERFRDLMVQTTEHLMSCGFRVVYGYTQSDEISLLFDPEDRTFGRKLRKLNSVLAAEASARFTSLLGDHAAFDCRISQLPDRARVRDYFRWRNEDAHPQRAERGTATGCFGRKAPVPRRRRRRFVISRSRTRTSSCSSEGSTSTTCPRGSGAASPCTGNPSSGKVAIRSRAARSAPHGDASALSTSCR